MNPVVKYKFDRPLHNEDAPAIATDKYLIVCDGLGAGGQNKHTINGETHTSAYYGSRLLSEVCREYYDINYDSIISSVTNQVVLNKIVEDLKITIKNRLDKFVEEHKLTKTIKGKSIKLLPSTLSSILYKIDGDSADVVVISAGDTRAFTLSPQFGMQQLSKDDVDEDVDAFEKATIVNNNICQDRDFTLNFRTYKINLPCILFVCSDGCYDYFSSPMEVEYVIDASFVRFYNSESTTFGENLGDCIAKLSKLQDDCSMAGVVLGFMNDELLKNSLKARAIEIESKYIKKYHSLDIEAKSNDGKYDFEIKELKQQISSLEIKLQNDVTNRVKRLVKNYLIEMPIDSSDKDLLNFILSDEKFMEFLEELSRLETEKIEIKKKKQEEKDSVYEKLREEFSKKFSVSSKSRNIYSSRSIASWFCDPADDLYNAEQKYQRVFESYIKRLSDFEEQFEYIKHATPQQIYENRGAYELSRRYQLLWNELNLLMGCENRIRGLKSQVNIEIPEIDENILSEAFSNAWKSNFSKYRGNSQYREVCDLFDQCKSLINELDTYTPFSEKDKLELFEKYYQQNGSILISSIMGFFKLEQLVDPYICNKLNNYKNKYAEIEEESLKYVNQKYALWSEYKTGYELFNSATCYGVI